MANQSSMIVRAAAVFVVMLIAAEAALQFGVSAE
jgi:hypothetical protein